MRSAGITFSVFCGVSYQPTPNNRTVDNFVVKLRRKFEEDNKNPRHILTVYGFGYKLAP